MMFVGTGASPDILYKVHPEELSVWRLGGLLSTARL